MSKKLKKISPGELIKNWTSLSDNYLHFVTRDRKVILALIQEFREKIFFVKTTKGHRLKLHLHDIEEVWQELKVSGK